MSNLFGFSIIARIAVRKHIGWYPMSMHALKRSVTSSEICGHANRNNKLEIPSFPEVVLPASRIALETSSFVSSGNGSAALGTHGVVIVISTTFDLLQRRFLARTSLFSFKVWAGGLLGARGSWRGGV